MRGVERGWFKLSSCVRLHCLWQKALCIENVLCTAASW